MEKELISTVKGFEGECRPVWLNTNILDVRVSRGITGFFKLTKKYWLGTFKTGKEFHGIIEYGHVNSTEGRV